MYFALFAILNIIDNDQMRRIRGSLLALEISENMETLRGLFSKAQYVIKTVFTKPYFTEVGILQLTGFCGK